MKKNTFFEKTAAPEPIHLMTEVTSILDSICKKKDHPRMALIQSHIFSKEGDLSKIPLKLRPQIRVP